MTVWLERKTRACVGGGPHSAERGLGISHVTLRLSEAGVSSQRLLLTAETATQPARQLLDG